MTTTRLIDAVRADDHATLEGLLAEAADVDEQDEQGWTPLCWAAGRGDVRSVELLLAGGADVTRTGRDNRTPLMIAKAAGRREVARLLTEAEQARGVWQDPRETRPYCRAYHRRDLAAFPGFPAAAAADAGEADDEEIVYLHQDYTVTGSMWHGEDVVFEAVTPEWKTFCRERLELEIPEDLL